MRPNTQSHLLLRAMQDGGIKPDDICAVGPGGRSRMSELMHMGCAQRVYVITPEGQRVLSELDRQQGCTKLTMETRNATEKRPTRE